MVKLTDSEYKELQDYVNLYTYEGEKPSSLKIHREKQYQWLEIYFEPNVSFTTDANKKNSFRSLEADRLYTLEELGLINSNGGDQR